MHRFFVMLIVFSIFALPSSAAAAAPFEPNDAFNTAYGPLVAGTAYTGAFETQNDSDYLYFYLPTLTQVQYQLVSPASNGFSYNSVWIYHAALDGSTSLKSNLEVRKGSTGTGAVTLDRGKYFALLCSGEDCDDAEIGDGYSFMLLPAGITSTYEPFAAECAAAHAPVTTAGGALTLAKQKLALASQKLRLARSRGAKRKAIRKLRGKVRGRTASVAAKKAAFEQAAAVEVAACSVPQ